MVLNVPDAQLDEYCSHIWDTFKVKITKGQLSHVFHENGISWKKVEVCLSPTDLCSCRKKHVNVTQSYAGTGYKSWETGERINWFSWTSPASILGQPTEIAVTR